MAAPNETVQPDAKLSIWLRFRHYILNAELSPERVAWSFAIGFSIAWNPIIGIHTGIAILCCLFFKGIHRPLLLIATFLNNPWTMVPIASLSVFFGNWLFGRGWVVDISGISWKSIGVGSFTSRQGFLEMYSMLEPILLPYLLGGFIASILAVPTGYWFMLWLSRKLRRNIFVGQPTEEPLQQPPKAVQE
jgi:uncharacterized protein (DUF2062 family)